MNSYSSSAMYYSDYSNREPVPNNSSLPVNGKVLRIHFACIAELPIGSTLRVSSSAQNWVEVPFTDSSSEHHSSNSANKTKSIADQQQQQDDDFENNNTIYSTSVEMVTTPESYPLWRTRTPVVVIVNNINETGVLRHRYRYLVVTPGSAIQLQSKSVAETPSHQNEFGITSDEHMGIVPVAKWEDPFVDVQDNITDDDMSPKSFYDKPYRTIEIDVSSISSPTFGKVIITPQQQQQYLSQTVSSSNNLQFTSDQILIDHYNDSSDIAFLPFIEQSQTINKSLLLKRASGDKSQTDSSNHMWTSEEDTSNVETDKEEQQQQQQQFHTSNTNNPNTSSISKRLFLVCFHLPVMITRDPNNPNMFSACFSESLLAKTEQTGVSKLYETHWVGTLPTIVPPIKTKQEKDAIRVVLRSMNCIPVFLDDANLRFSFYYGMCKQVLWPVFHNVDLLDIAKSGWGRKSLGTTVTGGEDLMMSERPSSSYIMTESDWDQSRLDGWWNAYCTVNQIFATTLSELVQQYDTVWVHDYHLTLLPKLLDAEEHAKIGRRTIQMVFFLHIPFPTSQVFRELDHGESILEGILHADVVGFHAFDHARHFLNASKRILGLNHESLVGGLIGVRYRGTKVLVTISNVSIESDVVDAALTLPSVFHGSQMLKNKFNGRIVIAGIDVAQGLSGVSLKLLAFERLLTDYPNWQNRVVMVQRCLIPGSRKVDEVDTLNHVRYLVRRIQNAFGSEVIDYEEFYGSILPLDQRLALWTAAEIFMATPIREGLNLLPLEYVFSRKKPATPGVTITSEFSAVCSVLNGALRVNPYDIKMTSAYIDKALTMDNQEKESRRERDIEFVSNCPSGMWSRNVLRDLRDVMLAAQAERRATKSTMKAQAKMEGITSPAAKVLKEIQLSSSYLDFDSVVKAYNYAQRRVFFIDFNGTIVMKEPPGKYLKREILGTSGNKPPHETIQALTELCADERNIVYVVSGDTEANIENAIGDIPGLGLAAGNGGSVARPLKRGEVERNWEVLNLGVDWEAVKRVAHPVLSKYTARANGSFVKLSSSSIGWSYYSCDPEYGSLLASHLIVELERELSAFDVRFVTLKGVIEVVPKRLNKGLIVKRVLQQIAEETNQETDFILCMGDDISDEKMFSAVFSSVSGSSGFKSSPTSDYDIMMKENNGKSSDHTYAFTVAVGKKASHASYFVDGTTDVAKLLITLSGLEFPIDRTMSWDHNDDHGPDLFA